MEQWGLINYQIDPKTKSSVLGPQYTGHFQITMDAPQGLVPFVPENAELTKAIPSNVTKTDDLNNENIPTAKENELPLNLEIRRNVYATGKRRQITKPTILFIIRAVFVVKIQLRSGITT